MNRRPEYSSSAAAALNRAVEIPVEAVGDFMDYIATARDRAERREMTLLELSNWIDEIKPITEMILENKLPNDPNGSPSQFIAEAHASYKQIDIWEKERPAQVSEDPFLPRDFAVYATFPFPPAETDEHTVLLRAETINHNPTAVLQLSIDYISGLPAEQAKTLLVATLHGGGYFTKNLRLLFEKFEATDWFKKYINLGECLALMEIQNSQKFALAVANNSKSKTDSAAHNPSAKDVLTVALTRAAAGYGTADIFEQLDVAGLMSNLQRGAYTTKYPTVTATLWTNWEEGKVVPNWTAPQPIPGDKRNRLAVAPYQYVKEGANVFDAVSHLFTPEEFLKILLVGLNNRLDQINSPRGAFLYKTIECCYEFSNRYPDLEGAEQIHSLIITKFEEKLQAEDYESAGLLRILAEDQMRPLPQAQLTKINVGLNLAKEKMGIDFKPNVDYEKWLQILQKELEQGLDNNAVQSIEAMGRALEEKEAEVDSQTREVADKLSRYQRIFKWYVQLLNTLAKINHRPAKINELSKTIAKKAEAVLSKIHNCAESVGTENLQNYSVLAQIVDKLGLEIGRLDKKFLTALKLQKMAPDDLPKAAATLAAIIFNKGTDWKARSSFLVNSVAEKIEQAGNITKLIALQHACRTHAVDFDLNERIVGFAQNMLADRDNPFWLNSSGQCDHLAAYLDEINQTQLATSVRSTK